MKIVFNGQEYSNLHAMPPKIREEYLILVARLGDANQNGIPDLAEGGTPGIHVQQMIEINGKQYHSLEEMPPDVRETYQKFNQFLGGNSSAQPRGIHLTGNIDFARKKNWRDPLINIQTGSAKKDLFLKIALTILVIAGIFVLAWIFRRR